MNDIMIFGNGWRGGVRNIEGGLYVFPYIPHIQDPHLREINFTVREYLAENGNTYLLGFSEQEPFPADVEEAILRHTPRAL